jgi:hypothetical protein
MVIADTLEGVVDECISFHYDFASDVLYLRLIDKKDAPAIGEETPDDLTLFRHEETDVVIGLDVISWWKRFGGGASRDSFQDLERHIETMANRLKSEAGVSPP